MCSRLLGNVISVTTILLITACETLPDQPLAAPDPFAFASFCENTGSGNTEQDPAPPPTQDSPLEADAEAVAKDMLQRAARKVAASAADPASCLNAFTQGEQRFLAILNGQQETLSGLGGYRKSSDLKIAEVQEAITLMWQNDQSARGTYVALQTQDEGGADYWAERRAAAHTRILDGESARFIAALLDQFDWVDRHRFGPEVSAHAWLLIQHADHQPGLQTRVLERMKPLLESGGVSRKNYAYLWDRVAVNSDRKQRYGTQPTWECVDGAMALKPLEAPDQVNERRAEMGLNSVEQGLASMNQQFCG